VGGVPPCSRRTLIPSLEEVIVVAIATRNKHFVQIWTK
jgi:hypothetical protein